MFMRAVRFNVMIALILAFFGVAAGAQTNQGQIAGNVLDTTGAAVGNATVTAKNEDTGSVYTAQSSGAGSYRFPSLALGPYTVTTAAQGFKSNINTGIVVRVGTVTALDIALTVGGTSESVTVTSDAPTVQTQSSEVGGTVTERQIVELPLALGGVGAMRSPEAFVFLIPGTTGPGSANSKDGIFLNKLGGGQNFGSEILLDGGSQTRSENGSSYDEEAPSVEAVSEFKVTTSSPSAEFGRTTGGIVNFVTKSGTNSYHGTAFMLFKNEALNANDWFNNGKKAFYTSTGNTASANRFRRPKEKKYDFGGTFGGPVAIPHIYNGHDKTFFFFAWEQYLQKLGGIATSSVPTAAERGGDFSDRIIGGSNGQINPCDGTPILNGQIFDPATQKTVNGVDCRSAFPGNQIPAARFNSVSAKIAALYPAPTNGALTNNYTLASSSKVTNTTYTIRIDHAIGANDKFYGSYSSRENTRNQPTFLTFNGPQDPSTQVQDFITHFGRGGYDHIFTPNLLNHFNGGYNRSNSINGSIQALTGINYGKQLGIPNVFTGLPRFNVDGYQALSRNQNDDNIDNGIRVNDSVSWQHGRNSFKIGMDYRYQQYSSIQNGGANGNFNFSANQTRATRTGPYSAGTGNGFASLLLGGYDFGGANINFHQARWISQYFAGFIQDDFKVSNNLILNIGFRYDVDQPRKEAGDFTSNFSETAIDAKSGTPGALVFAKNCNGCNKRWADTYYKDFGPRVGFAYTPYNDQKTVLRGGFATLYAPLQYSDFGGDTRLGFGNNIANGSNGFDPAFTIDQGLPPYTLGINLDPAQLDNGDSSRPRVFGNFIKPSYGRPGQVNQWNLQVQQELAKDLILTVGYIGSAGSHLKSQAENINNISKSNFALGDQLFNKFSDSAPVVPGSKLPYAGFNTNAQYQQSLRPFPQYGFIATDCCLQNVGHSSYHAMVASIERRFSQGLNLQASYTWSKNITNADSLINVTNGVNQEQDPSSGKSQKSISNQDIPHTFVTSFIYELPFGKNKMFLNHSGLLNSLIGGFKVGGVLRYQSGQPVSFGCADGIPGFDNCINFTRIPGSNLKSNARRSGRIDPFRNLKAGGNVQGPDPNVDSIFNGLMMPAGVNSGYAALQTSPAFTSQNQPNNRRNRAVKASIPGGPFCPSCDNGNFQLGNVSRVTGEVRNFLYLNEDLSFLKETVLTDRVRFILKLEALNVFNRHVFGTPDTQPYSNTFGVPGFTIDGPRNLQLTARFSF